ncbi:MAG: DUF3098 domain-containing protein [Bacteroidia bacterium]
MSNLKETKKPNEFLFSATNYKILIAGVVISAIGFMFMSGGGSADPNKFNADELFSFRRITLAPITVLAGYATVLYAILKRKKA